MKDYILSFTLLTTTLLGYSALVITQNKPFTRSSPSGAVWQAPRNPQSFMSELKPEGAETSLSAPAEIR